METIYYHLDARRVRVCDLASGGEETGPEDRYAVIPKHTEVARSEAGDKVLDFEACRRKLEGRVETGEAAGSVVPEEAAAAGRCSVRRTRRAGLLLDLCATAAIVVFALVASIRFLTVF